jgi:hypothetical protein
VSLASWFASFAPSKEEVRAEVWNLGVRHRGEGLKGARDELAASGLTPARTALLKACVREMRKAG